MTPRILTTLCTAMLLTALGCGQQSYEDRLGRTIARLRYQQRLDQFLNPPAEGAFKDMNIYVRSPKPMQLSPNLGLTDEPGQYDLAATFLALPKSAPSAEGDAGPDPSAAFRLHVLARVKKSKSAKKKGEAPPPEPATPRGEFTSDVRGLLAADTGAGDAVNQTPKSDKKGSNDFKRIVFTAANGNNILVYFYKQDIYDVALIWDVPVALAKGPAALTGRDLCLESFSVGRKAAANFAGPIDEDGSGSPEGAGAAGGAGGPNPGAAF
jgi:hypothetical protein